MALCRCGCGLAVKQSKGYKQTEWYSDAHRMRASRAKAREAAEQTPEPAKPRVRNVLAGLDIKPDDRRLVDRVRDLVESEFDEQDSVAQTQGALAIQLAQLAGEGSVSACRELRLSLLDARLAVDPSYEGEVTQGLFLRALLCSLRTGPPVYGADPAAGDLPPGWRSTAEDGEVLAWLGRRWYELRDAGDEVGLRDLEWWVGAHSIEIYELRDSGNWSVWPDERNSL
jgi:hypothetical protein